MEADAVLLLESKRNDELRKLFVGLGVEPMACRSIQDVLKKLRHEQFMAVIFDSNQLDIDVLELVLNIRDINDHIPVIIIGQPRDLENYHTLLSIGRVFIIDKDGVIDGISQQLEKRFSKHG